MMSLVDFEDRPTQTAQPPDHRVQQMGSPRPLKRKERGRDPFGLECPPAAGHRKHDLLRLEVGRRGPGRQRACADRPVAVSSMAAVVASTVTVQLAASRDHAAAPESP